jgi:RDD family
MKNFDNDVMDEFEFKPLTAGLGFHKKTDSKTNESTPARKSDNIEFRNPNMSFSTQSTNSTVTPSPARPHNASNNTQTKINIPTIEDDSILKAQSAVNEILKNLNHKKQQESQQKSKSKFEWKSTAPSIAAATLDAMFVAAMFLICMICMLTITKVDLLANFSNPGENSSIFIATGALLLAVSFIYMTLFRTYMGFTPGEWAFDQRCGKEIDQASSSYVPKVIARSLLVSLTGFIPLTMISFFLKFDLAGTLINLPLQKRA